MLKFRTYNIFITLHCIQVPNLITQQIITWSRVNNCIDLVVKLVNISEWYTDLGRRLHCASYSKDRKWSCFSIVREKILSIVKWPNVKNVFVQINQRSKYYFRSSSTIWSRELRQISNQATRLSLETRIQSYHLHGFTTGNIRRHGIIAAFGVTHSIQQSIFV